MCDQMKEQVGAFVGDLLKPRFKSSAITKEDYKWIVRKAVDKVPHIQIIRNSVLIRKHCFVWLLEQAQIYLHTWHTLTVLNVRGQLQVTTSVYSKRTCTSSFVFVCSAKWQHWSQLCCRWLRHPLVRLEQISSQTSEKPRLPQSLSTMSANVNWTSQPRQTDLSIHSANMPISTALV